MRPLRWWAESAPLGWDRVKASENLGATAVSPVAPVVTSLANIWATPTSISIFNSYDMKNWRPHHLNLVMISLLASKSQDLKLRGLQFHFIKWLKTGISILKSWHFEASKDIITKFRSKCFHTIRIKYWNASGSGSPPSLIPALWNIGILLHKQATLGKHFPPECILFGFLRWCILAMSCL